jgi:hypothetical protein
MTAVGVVAGIVQYLPGDRGYCITRLAQRVIPQALLYRYPFTQPNRRMLWNAMVGLLVELHRAGIFWGDPSLANVLIDLSHHQVRAMLADAETVELYPGPLAERRREQDLESLQESLLWTGEDIRQSRSAEAAPGPITEEDIAYIRSHYAALWQARGWTQLQQLGYAVRDIHWHATPSAAHAKAANPTAQPETVRPRWYQERIQEVLSITIPRQFARQFYGHLLTHKWLMSERAHTEVSLEDAARDWYERYHLPAITLLSTYFPSEADSLEVYLGVLDRKWQMSVQAGYEVSLEEAALDYALSHTHEAPVLHRIFNAVNEKLPQRSELGQLLHVDREDG